MWELKEVGDSVYYVGISGRKQGKDRECKYSKQPQNCQQNVFPQSNRKVLESVHRDPENKTEEICLHVALYSKMQDSHTQFYTLYYIGDIACYKRQAQKPSKRKV